MPPSGTVRCRAIYVAAAMDDPVARRIVDSCVTLVSRLGCCLRCPERARRLRCGLPAAAPGAGQARRRRERRCTVPTPRPRSGVPARGRREPPTLTCTYASLTRMQPAHPAQHPGRVPHRDRPACRRAGQRRGRGQRLLQALTREAVPERRPGDADRDRRQRAPRPGLQRPPPQPGRVAGQGSRVQPADTGSRACRPGHRPREPAFERIAHPSVDADGRRTPALRFGDPRVQALAGALCQTLLAATGITSKSLRALDDRTAARPLHPRPD
jgi:hypothetical protein